MTEKPDRRPAPSGLLPFSGASEIPMIFLAGISTEMV